jgi:hypothetical protein
VLYSQVSSSAVKCNILGVRILSWSTQPRSDKGLRSGRVQQWWLNEYWGPYPFLCIHTSESWIPQGLDPPPGPGHLNLFTLIFRRSSLIKPSLLSIAAIVIQDFEYIWVIRAACKYPVSLRVPGSTQ